MPTDIDWQREYLDWVERVCDTHDAVRNLVGHRIGDWASAEDIAAEVVIEMLARPRVFRYQGLPYSGRIAALAEPLIADRGGDWRETVPGWAEVLDALRRLPERLQTIHVALYVRGMSIDEVGAALDVTPATVSAREAEVTTLLRGFQRAIES